MIKVFKFGGASVKDASAVRNMARIIGRYSTSSSLLVVVSAMGKTTNALELLYAKSLQKDSFQEAENLFQNLKKYHFEIVTELFPDRQSPAYGLFENLMQQLWSIVSEKSILPESDESYDQIISMGEVISTRIVAAYLAETGLPALWQDAKEYVITDALWREARVDWATTSERVKTRLKPMVKEKIVITQGFIGATPDGRTTTLGREGSDFSAAIFAATLKADSVTIWKDVPGILNADPKRLPNTQLYDRLTYREAAEMTYYGATVIHPRTIRPLANKGIPLHVRSFIESDQPGTCIEATQPEHMVPAIIFKPDQRLLSFAVKDFTFISEKNLSTILTALAKLNIKINMMQNSAISFSICIDNNARKVDELIAQLQPYFSIVYNENLMLVTIKHYTTETIQQVTGMREIVLEQKSRHTYQALVTQ
jgi:aspartate kinase